MKKPVQTHIDHTTNGAESATRGAREVTSPQQIPAFWGASNFLKTVTRADALRAGTTRAPVTVWALSVAVAALFAVTGCQTGVSVSHTQAIGVPTFPPSDPAQVVILHTEPTRPHVRLGEVQVEPASDKTPVADIEGALRSEAAKLGADAVVIVADRMQITGAYVMGPWWGRSVDTVQGRVIVGVAIKYQ